MTEGKDYDSEKAKGGKVGKTPGKAGEMFDQFAFNIYEEHEQAEGGVIESKVTHGLKSGKGLKKGYGKNPGFKNKGLKNTKGSLKAQAKKRQKSSTEIKPSGIYFSGKHAAPWPGPTPKDRPRSRKAAENVFTKKRSKSAKSKLRRG